MHLLEDSDISFYNRLEINKANIFRSFFSFFFFQILNFADKLNITQTEKGQH